MVEDFSRRPSRLTVVENAPKPPRKLGPAGESLWNRIQSEFRVEDAGGAEVLMQICLAQDRVEEIAATIDADGARVMTKSGPKSHSLLRDETQIRSFICRELTRLGITSEVIQPLGRPARGFGWMPGER